MDSDRSQNVFVQLLASHQGLVHKLCRCYAHNADDRKDLFQEISLNLWKAFPTFRGESKITTWMYRVALNTAISGLRKSTSKIPTSELAERHHHMAEEETNTEEQFQQLNQAIQKLSEVDRAFILLYLDGMDYEEISIVMGTTVNNTRVKMSRIRDRINQLMEH